MRLIFHITRQVLTNKILFYSGDCFSYNLNLFRECIKANGANEWKYGYIKSLLTDESLDLVLLEVIGDLLLSKEAS